MANKFKDFAWSKTEYKSSYILLDGKIKLWGDILWEQDAKIDLKNKIVISILDSEYKQSKLPTLNELKREGKADLVEVIVNYTITPNTDWNVEDIIKEFEENGFIVSKKAIIHNYNAWKQDYKSGYKGKKVFLFTPCGCNRLSFTAYKISKYGKSWQTTYIA